MKYTEEQIAKVKTVMRDCGYNEGTVPIAALKLHDWDTDQAIQWLRTPTELHVIRLAQAMKDAKK
jgi:hypothetical protein